MGIHMVGGEGAPPWPVLWAPEFSRWYVFGNDVGISAEEAAEEGWVYLHPVSPHDPADIARLVAALRRYETWEANLILSNEAWTAASGLPKITDALWDELLEIQADRNTALAAFTAKETK